MHSHFRSDITNDSNSGCLCLFLNVMISKYEIKITMAEDDISKRTRIKNIQSSSWVIVT